MKRLLALGQLGVNFLREALVSGWTTALVILRGDRSLQPGFVHVSYGDLSDSAATFLGALVTLTPGTTAVDIDLERRELLLHLLDTRRVETTLESIRRDFMLPVRILFGGKS